MINKSVHWQSLAFPSPCHPSSYHPCLCRRVGSQGSPDNMISVSGCPYLQPTCSATSKLIIEAPTISCTPTIPSSADEWVAWSNTGQYQDQSQVYIPAWGKQHRQADARQSARRGNFTVYLALPRQHTSVLFTFRQ